VNLYVSSMIDESINEVRHEAVLEHFNKLWNWIQALSNFKEFLKELILFFWFSVCCELFFHSCITVNGQYCEVLSVIFFT
jgi:hypothetical protein